ncbi:PQQ-binding-like beta-propeller repeat protein [Patescibacteria group bacterium]
MNKKQKIKKFPIGLDNNGNLYSVADYNVLIHDSNDLSFKKSIRSDWVKDYILSNLAIDNENSAVYFGTQNGWLIKINTNTLEKTVSDNWPIYVGDGKVGGITLDVDGIIYAGTESGKFYAFNSDGTIKWLYDVGESIIQPAIVDSNGTIYVVSQNGKLYAF